MSNRFPPIRPPTAASDIEDEGHERRSYVIGLVLALVLTTGAFAVVWFDLFSGAAALARWGCSPWCRPWCICAISCTSTFSARTATTSCSSCSPC